MAILRDLLMDYITGGLASQTPQRNFNTVSAADWNSQHPEQKVNSTQYVDPKTGENITDKVMSGSVPLYQQPSLSTRALNPQLANEINYSNMQFMGQPVEQQQEASTRKAIGMQQYVSPMLSTVEKDANGNPIMTPNQIYAASGGQPFTPSQMNEWEAGVQAARNGYAKAAGFNEAQQAQNAGREAFTKGMFDVPEKSGLFSSTGLDYGIGQNSYRLNNLGTEASNYQQQLQNTGEQARQLGQQLPYMGQEGLNTAKLRSALSDVQLGLEPYTATTMAGNEMKNALNAQYMEPSMPFEVPLDVQHGTYGNIDRSPIGLSPMWQSMLSLQGGLPQIGNEGGPQTMTLPSGKIVTVNMPSSARSSGTSILPQVQPQGVTPEEQNRQKKQQQQTQPTGRQPIVQPMSLSGEIGDALNQTYNPIYGARHGGVWGPNAIAFYHWLQGY